MKKLSLVLMLLASFCHHTLAQVTPGTVEQMMTKRTLSCQDVEYNAILMIPRLYNEQKWDTLNALLSYTNTYCGTYEFVVTLNILRSIHDRNFREEINVISDPGTHLPSGANAEYYKKNIIPFLRSYKDGVDLRVHPGNLFNYTVTAYNAYYNFTSDLASSMIGKPGLTPVERFLVRYYAAPDSNMFDELSDSIYNGSVLQAAWRGDRNSTGFHAAMVAGAWMPSGKLATLGSHPYVGFMLGGKGKKLSVDISAHVRFIDAPQEHLVIKNDTPRISKYYLAFYGGVDAAYPLYAAKKTELDVLAGIAYDGIDLWLNPNNSTSGSGNSINSDRMVSSLNLNAGLEFKYYLTSKVSVNDRHKSYLGLQAKYNYVNYKNAGGTDLAGNAVTIGLVYGGFYYSINHLSETN